MNVGAVRNECHQLLLQAIIMAPIVIVVVVFVVADVDVVVSVDVVVIGAVVIVVAERVTVFSYSRLRLPPTGCCSGTTLRQHSWVIYGAIYSYSKCKFLQIEQ